MSESAIQQHVIREPAMSHHAAPSAAVPEQAHAHDRGLMAIGIFKLLKSAFFFCIGIGAIKLLHRDLGDVTMRLVTALHFDAQGRFVDFLVRKVDLIDMHRLKEVGFFTFAYSALALTEGIGLLLEQTWAEYLTLGLTISFLPWELYELAHEPDLARFALLLGNLAVLAYLVWLLRRKRSASAL